MNTDLTIMKALIKADYTRRVKTFRDLPILGHDVIIGDSMIAYMNMSQYGFNEVINMGIAGDTTLGVLNRLDAVIRQKPKRIILSIGSNDLVLTDHEPFEIVEKIIEIYSILSKESKVYVLTLTPINREDPKAHKAYIAGRKNEDIEIINQGLKDYLKDQVIDVAKPLMDHSHKLNITYSKDGIHLNEEGYHVFAKILKNTLV